MPVVSNTSPVLNLAIVDQLSLIHEQFGDLWVPTGVLKEMRIDEPLPGAPAMKAALEAGWLRIEEARDQTLVQVLERDLDRGEAEAIVLALQMKAKPVLLDEREGRLIAKSLGLKVTGVLGILLRARWEGKVSSMREAMDTLQEQAGFRIGRALYITLLKESGEYQEM